MKEKYGIRVEKEYLNFAAAHFVIYPSGRREALHGHNYYITAEVDGQLSEQQDLFIDFCDIKPILRQIADSLDHKLLLPKAHPRLVCREEGSSVFACYNGQEHFQFPKEDVLFLPVPNTTAECLSKYICAMTVEGLLEQYAEAKIERIQISLEETCGQSASYQQEFDPAVRLCEIQVANL